MLGVIQFVDHCFKLQKLKDDIITFKLSSSLFEFDLVFSYSFSFLKPGKSDALFCKFTKSKATEFKLMDLMEA